MKNVFSEILGKELDAVEKKIRQELDMGSPLVREVADHVFTNGGKRIRGSLAVACARMAAGGHLKESIDLAAAVEMLHNATLLHDDIVDEALFRRGKPAAQVIWGNKAAILVGDMMLAKSLQIITGLGHANITALFSQTMQDIITGELIQYENCGNPRTAMSTYMKIITGKTAKMFANTCLAGATLANAGAKKSKAFYEYGLNLGIVFQMVDDLLDYVADEKVLGKPKFSDIREGKVTLPLIVVYAKASKEDRHEISRIIRKNFKERDIEDNANLLRLLRKYDYAGKCEELIGGYAKKAKASLKMFDDREMVQEFHALVDFCIMRRY